MTIDQLRYVCAVVGNGSFSKASVEMHITQSALSKQIARLEKELNITLFDRSHRQVQLSVMGKIFYEHALILLEDHEALMNDLYQQKQQSDHTLNIALLPIVSQYDLAKKLQEFSNRYPNIQLHLHELEERDFMIHDVWKDYDCYILRDYHVRQPLFHNVLLYQDVLVAIISQQHPLAMKQELTLQDLAQEHLLLPPDYTSMSRIALQALDKAGIAPHILQHGRLETILSMAVENTGIALAMKKSLTLFQQDRIRILPISPAIIGDIRFYYPKQHEKKEIITLLLDSLK